MFYSNKERIIFWIAIIGIIIFLIWFTKSTEKEISHINEKLGNIFPYEDSTKKKKSIDSISIIYKEATDSLKNVIVGNNNFNKLIQEDNQKWENKIKTLEIDKLLSTEVKNSLKKDYEKRIKDNDIIISSNGNQIKSLNQEIVSLNKQIEILKSNSLLTFDSLSKIIKEFKSDKDALVTRLITYSKKAPILKGYIRGLNTIEGDYGCEQDRGSTEKDYKKVKGFDIGFELVEENSKDQIFKYKIIEIKAVHKILNSTLIEKDITGEINFRFSANEKRCYHNYELKTSLNSAIYKLQVLIDSEYRQVAEINFVTP